MLGNPWPAAVIGMTDLERRHELAFRARIRRQVQGWKPSGAVRLRTWLGGQLILAGEALGRVELVAHRTRLALEASGADLWRTQTSRV